MNIFVVSRNIGVGDGVEVGEQVDKNWEGMGQLNGFCLVLVFGGGLKVSVEVLDEVGQMV